MLAGHARGRRAAGRCWPVCLLAAVGTAVWAWRSAAFTSPGASCASSSTACGLRGGREALRTLANEQRSTRARSSSELAASGEGFSLLPIFKQLRVTALGGGKGSFLLEMGGLKLLINPVLNEDSEIAPEAAHEKADYIIVTSKDEKFFDIGTIDKMKLLLTDFVVAGGVEEILGSMMAKNMAVLAPGPGGRTLLTGREGEAADVAVLVAPGSSALPWQPTEVGFIFVNMETGLAVGYEAQGQFLGANAASTRDGIPEEAYLIDYLITPDLREASGVVKGLTDKGAELRGVVRLPPVASEEKPNLGPLSALDEAIDKALGGIDDDPSEFADFLKKQGGPLAKTRLLQPAVGGGPVDLEC